MLPGANLNLIGRLMMEWPPIVQQAIMGLLIRLLRVYRAIARLTRVRSKMIRLVIVRLMMATSNERPLAAGTFALL